MIKYIRFAAAPTLTAFGAFFALKGEHWMWVYFAIFALILIIGDSAFGDNSKNPKYFSTKILNFLLYINFPFLFIAVFASILMVGDFPLPDWASSFMIARDNTSIYHLIGYLFVMGLLVASAGTNIGHELTHRKKNKFDMFLGNWFLAFTWDCAFAIEHVYGHHKYVATERDPATAKRGQNPYAFILRSTYLSHRNAWIIENSRLKRSGHNTISLQNRMIIGYFRSGLLTAGAFYLSGWPGVIMFLLIATGGKIMLEGVNYMEHYGLVREEGAPIEPKHSWNTNKRISSILLYNLTRHSSHHENSSLEYWELKAYPGAPKMPLGYLSCVYLVLFTPWIYHRIMAPKLKEWDKKLANNAEKNLAKKQNEASGLSYLMPN
tara:strand:- start:2276 stop:3409 length:1134 start_codon:yes stop_codon:yes gene_type:complete